MIAEWQIRDLLALVRQRYPAWEGFDHPEFVADEIAPKRALAQRAQTELGKGELRRILETAAYDTLIERLEQLGKASNLLSWRREADLAILYQAHLDKWQLAEQVRQLLYDPRPSPDKIHQFSIFCQAYHLPNRWTFPTYFMFLVRPHREVFIKPRLAQWFLQFMGMGEVYTSTPSADMYERVKKNYHGLRAELAEYGAADMIDIHSFLYVAHKQSEQVTAGLDVRGHVELEEAIPALYDEAEELVAAYAVQESAASYAIPTIQPPYSLAQFAAETGHAPTQIGEWTAALQRKQQLVFYGPPGTGKSFVAHKLAQHLIGGTDGLLEVVQFHPAYDYVDFVEGLRPRTVAGQLHYEWVDGRLLDFCGRARQRHGPCVLLIDELNRANLPQVLGELMYLLEYRQQEVRLASGRSFALPANLYLVATMNTADRSIALVDHALRRRFAFAPLFPQFDLLRHYHQHHATGYNPQPLIHVLADLNQAIGDPHYALGLSYFMRPNLAAELPAIWRMEIEPYLEEYFFNRPDQLAAWRWEVVAKQVG